MVMARDSTSSWPGSLTFVDAHLDEAQRSSSGSGQEPREFWRHDQHKKHGGSALSSPPEAVSARECQARIRYKSSSAGSFTTNRGEAAIPTEESRR